ncbi:hypothetical protein [Hymenobacter terrenus]|uniref:hypothetical protein n=1 Tax=Hymenobacter terrenus TaxID=1629124 RepID=UPI000619FE87|nr:hypothetical protein [Hymenobacter terrenus]
MSEATLTQAATGRRELSVGAYVRLRPLAEALPPPWNPAPLPAALPVPLPAPDLGAALLPALPHAPDPAVLRARLAACQHLLLGAARTLAPLLRRQAQARRLGAVLPTLATAFAPATDVLAARWLPQFAAQAAERLGPAASTTLAVALARQQGLRLEAAQLTAWLGEAARDPADGPQQ